LQEERRHTVAALTATSRRCDAIETLGVRRSVIARSVSDEAIQQAGPILDCFASLAMTGLLSLRAGQRAR
jgi:hypothetical protein